MSGKNPFIDAWGYLAITILVGIIIYAYAEMTTRWPTIPFP